MTYADGTSATVDAAGPSSAGDVVSSGVSGAGDVGEIEAVRELLAAVDQIWAALSARVRMGTSEIVTLEALHFTSPLSTQHIRARTGLSPGAVTALLDRFETRGLTRRIRPEHNRRVVHVELTPAGRALSTTLFSTLVELVEHGGHDPDLPGPAVRVQCLHYTATLLRHAADLVAHHPPPP